jgi:hypothetical protein
MIESSRFKSSGVTLGGHPLIAAGQQTLQAAPMKLMNAASPGILAGEDHLGDLRDPHWLGRPQNDLASRLDRVIGSSMGKFLDHLLLSELQITHADFAWPGYGSTSLIVVFGLSFYHVSRRGFTALCRSEKIEEYLPSFCLLNHLDLRLECCQITSASDLRQLKSLFFPLLTLLLILKQSLC